MAAPNIVNITTLTGKTTYVNLTTILPSLALKNSALASSSALVLPKSGDTTNLLPNSCGSNINVLICGVSILTRHSRQCVT